MVGILRLVQVQHAALERAAPLEPLEKPARLARGDADGGEDDRERLVARRARALDDRGGQTRAPAGPGPEKTGSFWPRTSVFMPSIAEMPVSMKSRAARAASG